MYIYFLYSHIQCYISNLIPIDDFLYFHLMISSLIYTHVNHFSVITSTCTHLLLPQHVNPYMVATRRCCNQGCLRRRSEVCTHRWHVHHAGSDNLNCSKYDGVAQNVKYTAPGQQKHYDLEVSFTSRFLPYKIGVIDCKVTGFIFIQAIFSDKLLFIQV